MPGSKGTSEMDLPIQDGSPAPRWASCLLWPPSSGGGASTSQGAGSDQARCSTPAVPPECLTPPGKGRNHSDCVGETTGWPGCGPGTPWPEGTHRTMLGSSLGLKLLVRPTPLRGLLWTCCNVANRHVLELTPNPETGPPAP